MPPLTRTQAARVEQHTGLVRALARRAARNLGTRFLTVEELESVGNEALVTAALRYDPTQAASFATYVHYRIYGAMIDAVRKRSPSGRRRPALTRAEVTQDLLERAADERAEASSAGHTSTLRERVEQTRELLRQVTVATRLTQTEGLDALAADATDPQQMVVRGDDRRRIWGLVAELEPHERELIEAVYVHGRTLRDYAMEIGATASTVSRRHARILDRLGKRAAANERGVVPPNAR